MCKQFPKALIADKVDAIKTVWFVRRGLNTSKYRTKRGLSVAFTKVPLVSGLTKRPTLAGGIDRKVTGE
jgi:hypothetical protein